MYRRCRLHRSSCNLSSSQHQLLLRHTCCSCRPISMTNCKRLKLQFVCTQRPFRRYPDCRPPRSPSSSQHSWLLLHKHPGSQLKCFARSSHLRSLSAHCVRYQCCHRLHRLRYSPSSNRHERWLHHRHPRLQQKSKPMCNHRIQRPVCLLSSCVVTNLAICIGSPAVADTCCSYSARCGNAVTFVVIG